jgi:anti-sigma-K factor RskA
VTSTHITQEEADEFTLGACDAEAARCIALHIIECRDCEDLVTAAENLTARLALAAPLQRPRPELRRRLMEDAGIARPSLFAYALRATGVTATIAAIAIGAVALGGLLALRDDIGQLRQANTQMEFDLRQAQSQQIEIAVLTQQLASTSDQVTDLREQAQQDKQLQLAMLSPGSREANVYASEPDSASIGRFVWDPDQARIWFFATQLPPLPSGETYELFARVADGSFVSLGSFNADAEGFARFEAEVPAGLEIYDSAVVTVEQRWRAGARERTGPVVFVLDITNFGQ